MGAWGHGIFDNDTACDWVYELEKVNDLSLVTEVFDAVESSADPDSWLGCKGLAACEVLARLMGRPRESSSYTEALDQWISTHALPVPDELRKRGILVIDRIVGEDSELRELWDWGDASDWLRVVDDLRARLSHP